MFAAVAGTDPRSYNVAAYKCILAPKFVCVPLHRMQADFPGKVRSDMQFFLRESLSSPRAVPPPGSRTAQRVPRGARRVWGQP